MDRIHPHRMTNRLRIALLALLACCLAWGALYVQRTSFVVRGERVFCLWDDAMISMTYARNLRHGRGLVWNPGDEDPVQGFSNPGVTLLMAALHLLPLPERRMAGAFQALGLVLLGAILAGVARVASRGGEAPGRGAAAALAAGLCAPLAIWTLQGSDAGFVALWLLACVLVLGREPTPHPAALALLALGVVIRLDVALLYATAVAVAAAGARRPVGTACVGAAALAAVVGAMLLAGWLYYGDPLPNTFYLKATGAPRELVLRRGFAQLSVWLPGAVPVVACAAAGLWLRPRDRRLRLCAGLFAAALAYDVGIGGDWLVRVGSRFLAPALPLLLILAVSGAADLLDRLPGARGSTRGRRAGAATLLAGAALGLLASPASARREWLDPREPTLLRGFNVKNYRRAIYLRDFARPDTRVALHWAGLVPYFSGRRAIDVLGMSDRHIARLQVDRFAPGHSKYDWDYVMRVRRPDVIDAPSRGLERHPVFLRDYVAVVTGERDLRFWVRRDALSKLSDPALAIAPPSPPASAGGEPPAAAESPGVVRLLEQDAAFAGEAPASPADVARFDAAALRAWQKSAGDDGVRISSPPLAIPVDRGLRLQLRVRPGGARRIELSPFLAGRRAETEQALRSLSIGLERDAQPDAPVWVAADLTENLLGSWTDAARDTARHDRLSRLRILLPGADPERAALDELVVEDASRRYALAGAGRATIDRDGVLRPGWFVNPGARVRVRQEIPPGAELRFHEAAAGPGVEVVVRVGEGVGAETFRGDPAPPRWRHRSVPLGRWAGRSVPLEFSVRGGGIGFVGDPRVVTPAPEPAPPDVLVYLIDTLRGDRLGVAGRDLPGLSPTLDRLAETGVYFTRALSSSSWTKPAIVTLMTGLWPTTHRVGARSYGDRLPEGVALLQERLRRAGWRTGSFSASPLGSTLSALERGFGTAAAPRHWAGRIGPLRHPSAEQLHSALLDWIDEEPDRPFFAYVQTLEVHAWTQGSPEELAGLPEGYDRYDATVRRADAALGDLLAELASRGRTDDLLLVVLSDHGESFGDHGVGGHGTALYQSQVHIPLIFWAGDALEPRRVQQPVALADVPATLLEYLSLPPLPDSPGRSLVPLLRGGTEPVRRYTPISLLRYVWRPEAPRQFSLVRDDLAKIIRWSDGREAGYDVAGDPGEERELRAPADLDGELDRWLAGQERAAAEFERRHPARAAPIEAEDAERLRELGYLE